MSPVRKPQNHSGSFTGKFPSLKMKRMIHFESGVEKDFIYLLEFDERITSYEEQPLHIDYKIGAKSHVYTPDFRASVESETWIYECKPEKYVDIPLNKLKFSAAEKWCEEKEWGFQVITAELIREGSRLRNIKYLTGYARFIIRPELTGKIYSFFQENHLARLIDVVAYIPELSPKEVFPALFHMAYHHHLSLDIDHGLLSPLSEIQLANGEKKQ